MPDILSIRAIRTRRHRTYGGAFVPTKDTGRTSKEVLTGVKRSKTTKDCEAGLIEDPRALLSRATRAAISAGMSTSRPRSQWAEAVTVNATEPPLISATATCAPVCTLTLPSPPVGLLV
jgi:hypothetical protein